MRDKPGALEYFEERLLDVDRPILRAAREACGREGRAHAAMDEGQADVDRHLRRYFSSVERVQCLQAVSDDRWQTRSYQEQTIKIEARGETLEG